eukprot:11632373-Heterocapsa_arctica.AAC.1
MHDACRREASDPWRACWRGPLWMPTYCLSLAGWKMTGSNVEQFVSRRGGLDCCSVTNARREGKPKGKESEREREAAPEQLRYTMLA